MVLVSQSVLLLPLPAAVLVTAARPAGAPRAWPWGDGLRNGLGTLAAAVFTAVVTELLRREQQARAELAAANDRLRGYAAQAEELATTQERNRLARDIHDGLGPPPHRRPDAGAGRARGARHRPGQGPTPCSPRPSSRPPRRWPRSAARWPRCASPGPRPPLADGAEGARRATTSAAGVPDRAPGHRAGAGPAGGRGGVAVPGRAGGADQRAQARRGRPRRPACSTTATTAPCGWRSATTAAVRPVPRTAPGFGLLGLRERATRLGGRSTSSRRPAGDDAAGGGARMSAASAGAGAARRRPGAVPRGAGHAARGARRDRGRRRGRRRRRGAGAVRRAAARRRPDGPAHAGARRHRRHPPAPRRAAGGPGARADHLRRRRGRVRRAAGRRRRLPAEGRHPRDRLVEALLAAARGESVLQPSVAAKVVARFAALPDDARAAPQPLVVPLSDRELEVLRLLAEGGSNREIAGALFLAEGTVKNHVTNVLAKLGARDRTQAALRARALGPDLTGSCPDHDPGHDLRHLAAAARPPDDLRHDDSRPSQPPAHARTPAPAGLALRPPLPRDGRRDAGRHGRARPGVSTWSGRRRPGTSLPTPW